MIDIGVDVGKRRLSFGSPMTSQVFSIDLKKPGDRAIELSTMSRWVRNVAIPGFGYSPSEISLWIEAAYVGTKVLNISTAMGLAETIGVVQSSAQWGMSEVIGTSTWKSAALGNWHADKDFVAKWLEEFYPDLFDICHSQDEIDALCIGIYGTMRADGRVAAPVHKPKKRKKKVVL